MSATAAALGSSIAFAAYFLTDTWQWRGDVDGLIQAHGLRRDAAYQVTLLLLLASVVLQSFALGRFTAPSSANRHRPEAEVSRQEVLSDLTQGRPPMP